MVGRPAVDSVRFAAVTLTRMSNYEHSLQSSGDGSVWFVRIVNCCLKWHGGSKKMFYFFIITMKIRRNIRYFNIRRDLRIIFISFQIIKTHPDIAHVNKPRCFGHWFQCHVIVIAVYKYLKETRILYLKYSMSVVRKVDIC